MRRRTSRRRVWQAAFLLILLFSGAVLWSYLSIPSGNTAQDHFDAILVLGAPTTLQGKTSDEQRWRVEEGVREFRAGRAPRLLFSGAAVAYRFIEAEAMAAYARTLGVPPEAILTETHARNTIQNIRYSETILKSHGWSSVEVISSRDHLPRAALILQSTSLRWRVHASPIEGRSLPDTWLYYGEEAITTALLRWFGLRLAPLLHAIAVVQHALGFAMRWSWYHLRGKLHRLG